MSKRVASLVCLLLASCQPDFAAYCSKAAPCEDKSVESCVESRRKGWNLNRERGCGAEDEALLACEIAHGKCERSGSLSAFMPGDGCDSALQKKSACLERTRR